jgi:hypothetical protein
MLTTCYFYTDWIFFTTICRKADVRSEVDRVSYLVECSYTYFPLDQNDNFIALRAVEVGFQALLGRKSY